MISKVVIRDSSRSNTQALLFVFVWLLNFVAAVFLIRLGGFFAAIAAQFLMALFLFQSFVLLHEAGHGGLFRTRSLHVFLGTVTGFISGIPYACWKPVHALHHVWTGYRDLDPTTEKTFVALLSPRQQRVINLCWKFWIPLFTLGYRIGIFWNSEKLKRHLSPPAYAKARISMAVHLVFYIALVLFVGHGVLLFIPAIVMSFIFTDLVTLSQHSHIRMKHSEGRAVSPISTQNQVVYTRSLIVPRFVSRLIFFNFNLHEAHHAAPSWPCYRLENVPLPEPGGVRSSFARYVRESKRLNGVDFIFNSKSDCPF